MNRQSSLVFYFEAVIDAISFTDKVIFSEIINFYLSQRMLRICDAGTMLVIQSWYHKNHPNHLNHLSSLEQMFISITAS